MSVLTAYLREAQAQQPQADTHRQSTDSHPNDSHWPSAMSERQQLAFRSLSEAAVDHRFNGRNSDMIRAAVQSQRASNSPSFPGDIIQPQGAPSTAGMTLAQQSLLYAPSQVAPRLMQQHQFPPRVFSSNSGRSSTEQAAYRSSDPGRRPSLSNQDWVSTTSGPSRNSLGSGRYSQESDFYSSGRRGSMGVTPNSMQNSLDLDWAGRPVGKPDLDWAGRPVGKPDLDWAGRPVSKPDAFSVSLASLPI